MATRTDKFIQAALGVLIAVSLLVAVVAGFGSLVWGW